MASSTIVLADAPPTVQLGSTYGVFLVSIIVAATLYGFTVLQSLFYYQEFPKDRLIMKVTVAVLWALDTFAISLSSHAIYFYLVSNFTNISALQQEVWSVQAELLVTYTVVIIVQFFFILRIYHLRPHLWYIPLLFGLLALGSYASVVAVFIKVELYNNWSDTAPSGIIPPIIANWTMGNVVDIGITVVLCWYLWSEKAGVPHRTDVMLNHIIVFLVNRGAIAAVVQVMTLLTKLVMPQNFVWIAFHNLLSKVYTNSMLATLNARVGFRKIIMDYQLDQTVPPVEFSTRRSRPMSKAPPLPEVHQISFVDGPVYPPAALDHHHNQRSTYATYDSRSASTGTGSGSCDQRNGLAPFHQRSIPSDRSSVATDFTGYPPHLNRAASVGSRYTRTRLHSLRDDEPMIVSKHSNVV